MSGEGRLAPALLLHGQPGTGRDWARVVAALPEGVTALPLDRPGWDGSRAATDLAGNADAALAALDAAGIERAVVAGHSFGGGVAAWLAVHHPQRVAGLVLAAPAANLASLYAFDRLLAAPLVGSLASGALLAGAAGGLDWAPLRQAAAARFGLDEGYLRSLSRMLARPSSWRSFVVEQRAMVRDLPVLERVLGRISAPTVIVAGAGDRVVPAAAARGLADQIPGSELVLLERAGHLLPHRHAERLAEIIVRVGG